MITLSKGTLIHVIKYKLSQSYRNKIDANTRESIKWLIEHPDAPCDIGGVIIPNGYGVYE